VTARFTRLFKHGVWRSRPANIQPMSAEEQRHWDELRRRREARRPNPEKPA